MSRYLAYSDPHACERSTALKEEPSALGTVWLCGIDKVFQTYLKKDQYQGGSVVLGCNGRFVGGQIWPNTVSTAVMIVLPGAYYFCGPLSAVVPDGRILGCYMGISQSILAVLIVFSFILASFVNPGIVPRNQGVHASLEGHLDMKGHPLPRFLLISSRCVKQKFCNTCLLYRPPRSKHCQFCDNCVLRFDHHCSWLGNCVGLYNYRYYLCLIYSATWFLLQVIITVIQAINQIDSSIFPDDDHGLWQGIFEWTVSIAQDPFLMILLIYCLTMWVAVTMLTIYHTVITTQNLTTNEHVKNIYVENPFDNGWVLNCLQVHCRPEQVAIDSSTGRSDDVIEASYQSFGSYESGYSFDET